MNIEILRLLEENLRDQSAFSRQRGDEKVVGQTLYGLSQAVLITRIQIERKASTKHWWKPWSWI